jgi:tetratricopeptide (TPR) repeat protein
MSSYVDLGYAYARLGRYQDAVITLNKVIAEKPRYSRAHYALGWTYGEWARYKESAEAYKQAISRDPNSSLNRYALGWTFEKLGLRREALREYQEAARLKSDYSDASNAVRRLMAQLKSEGSSEVSQIKIKEIR